MKNPIQSYKERKAAKAQAKINSELSKVRKPEDIQKEYHGLCAELGDKNYKMKVLEKETEAIKNKLYVLNQEFHRSTQVHKPAPAPAPANAIEAPKEQLNEAQPV